MLRLLQLPDRGAEFANDGLQFVDIRAEFGKVRVGRFGLRFLLRRAPRNARHRLAVDGTCGKAVQENGNQIALQIFGQFGKLRAILRDGGPDGFTQETVKLFGIDVIPETPRRQFRER